MRSGRQVAIAAMLLLAVTRPASADALAEARKAIDGSDYLAARPLLESALKSGTQGPAELAEIYKLTGIVDGALNDPGGAQIAFGKWLALDPKGSLPNGTSPRFTKPFDVALAKANKTGPLTAKSETDDDPPTVTLIVTRDPMKMIVGARVFFSVDQGTEKRLEAEGHGKIRLALERGNRIDLRLQGVDEYGNRVIELGSHDVPIVITSSGTEPSSPTINDKVRQPTVQNKPPPPGAPRPWYLQWWAWGAVAVVATGTGGYFAWQTHQDIDEIHYLHANSLAHPWSDEQAVEDRARTHLLVTNIAAGTAGVFAIGTLVLYLTRPHQDAAPKEHLTAVPIRGGAALVVGGHF